MCSHLAKLDQAGGPETFWPNIILLHTYMHIINREIKIYINLQGTDGSPGEIGLKGIPGDEGASGVPVCYVFISSVTWI